MGTGYMHRRDELQSGRASGVSVLSSPRADSWPRGKGRVRRNESAQFGVPPVLGHGLWDE
jgi:hypothetical protein